MKTSGRSKDIADYINANGGDYSHIERYAERQAYNSWNDEPGTVKYWYGLQQNRKDVFWGNKGFDYWKQRYERFWKTSMAESYTAYHAHMYEFFRKVTLPNKVGNAIILMRTESKWVMNGLKPGQKNCTMPRGLLESTSLMKKVEVEGTELTRQMVPLHRIHGFYGFSRNATDYTMFLSEGENEIIANLADLPFDYSKH